MWDDRKKQLLTLLLQEENYISTETAGKQLHCSEKTVRNDLKAIHEWLQIHDPTVSIHRKPGLGVLLKAHPKEKERLKKWLGKIASETDPQWQMQVVRLLLRSDEFITLRQLCNTFYMSRKRMRKILNQVERWAQGFDLTLLRKPHFGIKIEGNEKEKRLALSKTFAPSFNGEQPSSDIAKNVRFEFNGIADPHQLTLIESKIRQLQQTFGFHFTDQSISNMLIHIAIAIQRIKLGNEIYMPLQELKYLQNQWEYQPASALATELEKTFAIHIPETERGYLTLHLLGAKLHYHMKDLGLRESIKQMDTEALAVAEQLIEQMNPWIEEPLKEDTQLLIGLALHLRSTIHRLRHGLTLLNPMNEEIKVNYRHVFELIYTVISDVEKQVGVRFPEDEVAYLTLHVQAALERLKNERRARRRVLVVCTTGVGTSLLIVSKLKRYFPSLEVADSVSTFELRQTIAKVKPDFVISTVPLPNLSLPVVTISPLLNEEECEQIQRMMEHPLSPPTEKPGRYLALRRYLHPELIFLDVDYQDNLEVIQFLTDSLVQEQYVEEAYGKSVIEREHLSHTFIGGGIAIPHGSPELIRKSGIAIARLREPVHWGGEEVTFVFLLAVQWTDIQAAQRLFEDLNRLSEDKSLLKSLKGQHTVPEFLSVL